MYYGSLGGALACARARMLTMTTRSARARVHSVPAAQLHRMHMQYSIYVHTYTVTLVCGTAAAALVLDSLGAQSSRE